MKNVIFKFIQFINTLPDIETPEREDTRDAVYQLVKGCHLDISEHQVKEWFDEEREF